MVNDRVAKELRAALDSMQGERDNLSKQISAMEALLSQMGSPAKRGPGRPKAAAPAVAGVKRGPGRPKKVDAAPAEAAAAAPAKRGPGRPKGSKNKADLPVKRGPGRPKKAAVAAAGGAAAPTAGRRAPKWSSAAREAARARMKAYWAERRKAK